MVRGLVGRVRPRLPCSPVALRKRVRVGCERRRRRCFASLWARTEIAESVSIIK